MAVNAPTRPLRGVWIRLLSFRLVVPSLICSWPTLFSISVFEHPHMSFSTMFVVYYELIS